MAVIELEKQVQLFVDEDTMDTQKVVIDTNDELEPWMVVSHCGEEISLSVRNWNNINALVLKAKKKANLK